MVAEDRYNAQGQRMVAGCIPYRKEKDSDSVEILMVKSQNGHNVVLPKGGWEEDESLYDAALREAQEEAGVQGHVQEWLGVWTFNKIKQQRWGINPEGVCEVHVVLMEVTAELETWPEQHRGREWIDLNDIEEITKELCHHNWMRQALGKFIEQQTRGIGSTPSREVSEWRVMRQASHCSKQLTRSPLTIVDSLAA